MGWISISKTGEILSEATAGRPVQAGEEGKLAVIAQEDYGRKVAVDLFNGIIAIDYDSVSIQNGTVEMNGHPTLLWICEETNIVGNVMNMESSEPDSQGNYINTFTPLQFRPIWFTRIIAGMPVKVIGAQTTLPEVYGSKNVKCMVSIFTDGKIGISN